ncbi:hypothetical protein N0V84_005372 [Fusarium piperis]|uniref:AT hook domain-containing protein n=1 Tax=Fusarium piperis TaxID=1435070 RepID=A0A9W8WDU0_9HYPO|nr:hypothetical protein N0V84_005372 [Fusarium piperis]
MTQDVEITTGSTRQTRSSTRRQQLTPPTTNPEHVPDTSSGKPPIECLSSVLTHSTRVLRNQRDPVEVKRTWLSSHTVPLPQDRSGTATYPLNPVDATFVFAQEQAGTAVCISPDGVLLTCSHCIAESASELSQNPIHMLLSSKGAIVSAHVMAWDPTRDLALLMITEAELPHRPFPHVRLAAGPAKAHARLICVGHPGSEDLEAERRGVPTEYDTLVLSEGKFHGLAAGQDPQDNSDVGALKHSCWTYWGHSGAGLFDRRTGTLLGLHSSWDEDTGMRRGVPFEAVSAFLDEFDGRGGQGMGEGWKWFVREES